MSHLSKVVILCWSELIHVKLIFNWISLDITKILDFKIPTLKFQEKKFQDLKGPEFQILGFIWIMIP